MNSFLAYLGGKSGLADTIIPKFPPHTCYCEVFAGAAWIFFKKSPSKVEVINDINSDLVTLYRVIQNHLDEFVRYFRWTLAARDEFNRLLEENPTTLTDIQRAARFYYLLKSSYGARVKNQSFGYAPTAPPRINILRIEEDLSAVHLRLARAYIENLSYEKLISNYDRPETFFYIDPPYWGCEDDYGKNVFRSSDFDNLKTILKAIKGRFMLSINDVPEIREIFKDFQIEEVKTTYSIGKIETKNVGELLVMNYTPANIFNCG